MAEHGYQFTLSQMSPTSDDDSSDQNIDFTGGSGGSSSHRIPPPPAGHHLQHHPPAPKKPRGRPPGSKNKPKPPLVITQDSDEAMKPLIIEVAPGSDVMEAVVNFARRRHVGISVLSASGTIANLTLRHPLSCAPAFTLHGPFTLLSFTGTYIAALVAAPSSSNPNPPPPPHPVCNSFAVSLSGSQGQIFGGVIAGKITASSTVAVMASMFKKPEFLKVGFIEGNNNNNNNEGVERGDNPNPIVNEQGGGSGSGSGGGGGGGGGGNSDTTISGFNVAAAVVPLNPQLAAAATDVNILQWAHHTHTHPSSSSTRPPNY